MRVEEDLAHSKWEEVWEIEKGRGGCCKKGIVREELINTLLL